MKIQVRHHGRVRSGEVIWTIPELYRQQLMELEGKNIEMIIKESHVKPSISKHAYYRGGILVDCHKSEFFISMDRKDDIHDLYFAPKFLSYVKLVNIPNAKPYEVTVVRSTADLTDSEMGEFISRVVGECANLEIPLTPPEMFYNKYYQK